MKKIEDYLHLYLGQKVEVIYKDQLCAGRLTGVYHPRGMDVQVVFNGNEVEEPTYFEYGGRLILRDLSDMTEKELRISLDFMEAHFSKDLKLYSRIKKGQHIGSPETWTQWYYINYGGKEEVIANLSSDVDGLSLYGINNYYRCYAKTIPFLIKKGFDLFGLIKAGLAIDKTQLDKP